MANLLQSLLGKPGKKRYTIDDWYHDQAQSFAFNGIQYPILGGAKLGESQEDIENNFTAFVRGVYKSNGPVFACMAVRQMVFSEARFQWQQLRGGRPGDLFGTSALGILEKPWPNGTTGELLARAEQDASLGGNFYVVRENGRLRRLRPDWVSILLTAPPDEAVESDVAGYLYQPGGPMSKAEPRTFNVNKVTHWSPIPDPEAQYRGMSWITPIIREVQGDKAAMIHKLKFFENGASPQLAVTLKDAVSKEQFKAFIEQMNQSHRGVQNAYKTLFLGAGADVTVVGADLQQLDFKVTQGAGETRIAAASGVGAVVAQLSEGMQGSSLNAGNYAVARRRVADGLFRPLWRSISAALETVAPPPSGARLWYDVRDIPFLREDSKIATEIEQTKASTITMYVREGFTSESAVAAVENEDVTLLEHTGKTSVQLIPEDAPAPTP